MSNHRAILHVDMDAFYASIEQLDDPALRDKPVLVGSDAPRGVVAAASYEARAFGCHSAQPMAIARRRCPHAVVVPPRGGRYREVSEHVFGVLELFTPLVEPLSIDEAFMDVTGSQRLCGPPEKIAAAIKEKIRGELHLTASIGVAPNKFLAKLGSDLDKPDGLTVIGPQNIEQAIAPLPVRRMWGVGPGTEKRLHERGLRTFGDLQRCAPEVLASLFGVHGQRIGQLSRGEDHRDVVPDAEAKSISHEQTFTTDVEEPEAVRTVLLGQAEQVARRLRKSGCCARTVTVKIRYGDFETITRSFTFGEPTDQTEELWQAGRDLFDRWVGASFQPVRLIGFGASQLTTTGDQLQLFTHKIDERHRALDRVTDSIQAKFGPGAIHRGGTVFSRPDTAQSAPRSKPR